LPYLIDTHVVEQGQLHRFFIGASSISLAHTHHPKTTLVSSHSPYLIVTHVVEQVQLAEVLARGDELCHGFACEDGAAHILYGQSLETRLRMMQKG